jgi:uncharacterized membrane protein YccC
MRLLGITIAVTIVVGFALTALAQWRSELLDWMAEH